MKPILLLSIAAVILQVSCTPNQSTEKAAMQEPLAYHPTQRFVALPGLYWGFDTQTGQLCKSWDWIPRSVGATTSNENAEPGQNVGKVVPTCLTLYTVYPTGVKSAASPKAQAEAEKFLEKFRKRNERERVKVDSQGNIVH